MNTLIDSALNDDNETEKAPKQEIKVVGKGTTSDEELLVILQDSLARIKIIGAGGSGNNTLRRMAEVGIKGAELIGINTDAQHLLITPAEKKVLIGKRLTKGLGAGAMPEVGEAAAKESTEDISAVLQNSNLVFITCGLGGGTGTGSAPIVAQIAREMGALTVGIVTLPFSVEGKREWRTRLKV